MALTGGPRPSWERSGDVPSREHLIEKAKARLLRRSLPRLQMTVVVALTGAAGFLSSYTLLQLGMDSMTARYPLAVAVAYGVFLLLLRVWLHIQRHGLEVDPNPLDLLDAADTVASGAQGAEGMARGLSSKVSVGDGGSGKSFDFSLDLDDGAFLVLLALLILTVTALGTALWIVWTAPSLLAEVLVDGLVMTGLYHRLRGMQEPSYWLLTAVRRTWVSAVIAALLFSFAGKLLHKAAPQARSIGAAWKVATEERRAGESR
jgi:hypothetical protein